MHIGALPILALTYVMLFLCIYAAQNITIFDRLKFTDRLCTRFAYRSMQPSRVRYIKEN